MVTVTDTFQGKDSSSYREWVDISKGIVIILMVMGHASIPISLRNWIYSFHMPFFFFISALCINWDREPHASFAKRKAKALLIPFVVYSVLNLFFWPYFRQETSSEYFFKILTEGWGGVALWFVPIFFLSTIVCKLTPIRMLLPVATFGIVATVFMQKFDIVLPWTLSALPFAVAITTTTRCFKSKLHTVINRLELIGGG